MKYTAEGPKLPKLPFIAGDLFLLATAVFVALRSAAPIQPIPLLVIGLCVIFGAALLVVPFLADYARRQDAELTERQNQIAALARTTAESADQLSIAASGLNTIADSSKQTFEAAEKLPAKLRERIDVFTEQFGALAVASQNALREDIAQLEAAAEKITRTLAKFEAAAKTKSDALVASEAQLAAAETRLAEAVVRATERIDGSLNEALARVARAATQVAESAEAAVRAMPSAPTTVAAPAATSASSGDSATVEVVATPASEARPHEPKRVRAASKAKQRIDAAQEHTESGAEAPAASASVSPESETSGSVERKPAVVEETASPESTTPVVTTESRVANSPRDDFAAVAPVTPIPEIETPASASVEKLEPASADSTGKPVEPEEPVAAPPASSPKLPRARKPKHDDGFDLGLAPEPSEPGESALTSDGFTRLIATAYIGIGNKLYIRGEGPGLSWDKGVPLQFVSIGKWRWESADVDAPITAKLYKNDQVECVGLGTLTLEPGRQHEVNAGF